MTTVKINYQKEFDIPENFFVVSTNIVNLPPKTYGINIYTGKIYYNPNKTSTKEEKFIQLKMKKKVILNEKIEISSSDFYPSNVNIPDGFSQGIFGRVHDLYNSGYRYFLTKDGDFGFLHNISFDEFVIALIKDN